MTKRRVYIRKMRSEVHVIKNQIFAPIKSEGTPVHNLLIHQLLHARHTQPIDTPRPNTQYPDPVPRPKAHVGV